MSNPLLNGPSGTGGNGPLRPGDVRIIHAKDKNGNIIKTYTLRRTERPYVEDLCDAYNEGLGHDGPRWFVAENGELRMGFPQEFSVALTKELERKAEGERRRWVSRQQAA